MVTSCFSRVSWEIKAGHATEYYMGDIAGLLRYIIRRDYVRGTFRQERQANNRTQLHC